MTQKSKEAGNDFADKMTKILNYGALNLAMALGYNVGLFDVMDRFDSPQTSEAIAQSAQLDGRYVKEWLAVMVCGGIAELSQDASGRDRYILPKAHGNWITRRSGSSNMGVYTQEIPLLTLCAMEPVIKEFKTGGGVSYDQYPKFQHFMTQLANAKHHRVLVDAFLPSVDDGRLVQMLADGIRVCDLGCGQGVALLLMAEAFPKSRFVGIDIGKEAIMEAEAACRRKKVSNAEFIELDAGRLKDRRDLAQSFDYVTAFDAVHDQTQPQEALFGVFSILKPKGLFSMVDIAANSHLSENKDHPMGPFLYTVSLMHCMPVGLVDGGRGLGMMWGRQKAVAMLKAAGFKDIGVAEIPGDAFNLHFLCKKPSS